MAPIRFFIRPNNVRNRRFWQAGIWSAAAFGRTSDLLERPSCRLKAAFRSGGERRLKAAEKDSVVRAPRLGGTLAPDLGSLPA